MSENDNHPQEYTPTTAPLFQKDGSFQNSGATIPENLRNRMAEALAEVGDADEEIKYSRVDAVIPFLAEVRAEAWDEGMREGYGPFKQEHPFWNPTNPHRLLSPSTPNPETEGQA